MTDDEPLSVPRARFRAVQEERNQLANTIVGGLIAGLDPVLYSRELRHWAVLTAEFDQLADLIAKELGL